MTGLISAQNAAANKAFFAKSVNEVTLGAISGNGYGPVVTLFDIPAAFKTSNGGAASATLSMEAALWTASQSRHSSRRGEGSRPDRMPRERNCDSLPRPHARRLRRCADDGGDWKGDVMYRMA
jgi:hypothetical protein